MKLIKVKWNDGITGEASRAMNKANKFASDVDYCIKNNGNCKKLMAEGEELLNDPDFQSFDSVQFKTLVERELELLQK